MKQLTFWDMDKYLVERESVNDKDTTEVTLKYEQLSLPLEV